MLWPCLAERKLLLSDKEYKEIGILNYSALLTFLIKNAAFDCFLGGHLFSTVSLFFNLQ